jgi:hypothetical protein
MAERTHQGDMPCELPCTISQLICHRVKNGDHAANTVRRLKVHKPSELAVGAGGALSSSTCSIDDLDTKRF